ncbi:helix-turn-helix transcriptional regulator [Paenibacillus pectinilyticus]|nr:AAA family ATPase [Paenibacillus pectinilyticus]
MSVGLGDIRTFFFVALELVELIRKRHLSGRMGHDLHPAHLHIQFLDDQRIQLHYGAEFEQSQEQDALKQAEPSDNLAYMSPEQTGRLKRKVDQRSDFYVAGILLYELLTGEVPFKAQAANEWIYAHLAQLPVPPRQLRPDIPQMVNELVLKLLSKTPEHRYQSTYGLREDLKNGLYQLEERGEIKPFPLGIVDGISRFHLPDKLYGRELEMQSLLEAYERTCSGEMEVIFIGGHAGSGKTTLVNAFKATLLQQKGYFISGKFDQLNHSIPYASLITAFRNLIRQILTSSEDQIASWKKKILAALGQSGIVLTEVISELTLIIGEQPPVESLPPNEARHRYQTQFSNLIKVFADSHHPLTIWMDNLQWADSASLDLLRVVIGDPSHTSLCIIGTYRSHEMDEVEIGRERFLGVSYRTEATIHQMDLQMLGYPVVLHYLADMLHTNQASIKSLADALYQKTAGNPFYIKQILQTWYEENLLYFNSDKSSWDWNLPAIQSWEGFKDVISLIVGRFNTLPAATRAVLRLASCIGTAFDIRLLALLQEKEITSTEQDLLPAVSEGLMLTEQDTYRFLHDQVQQAAYDLIPDEEKQQIHLTIGRLLHQHYESDRPESSLFEVVHHLNLGSGLMRDGMEIEQLARLNLRAGKKAKARAAYVEALELLKKGTQLIASEGLTRHNALYTSLLLESSECQYFCGELDQAKEVLEELLLRVDNLAERAKIYVIQISMYAFQKKEEVAIDIALTAMAEFGLKIPRKCSPLTMATEITYTQLWLARKMKHLEDLPISQDPLHKALADIVMASSSILFIMDEKTAVVLFAKYVRMSMEQGSSEALSIALGSYAITLCFGLKKDKVALQLAQLALRFAEGMDSVKLKGKIQLIVALIKQSMQPKEANAHFEKASQLSLACGDMVYAGYAISSQVISESNDLNYMHHICQKYEESANRGLDIMTLKVLHFTLQYIRLLHSPPTTAKLTFSGVHFNESDFLQGEIGNNSHKHNLSYYYTCKLEVSYLYGHYLDAVVCAEATKKFEAGSSVLSFNRKHCFYYALALMAVYPNASSDIKRRYRKVIKRLLTQMKRWTKAYPEGTLAKYAIMQAELARIQHKPLKAGTLYDQAIRLTQEAGYPQDEAIANELAARMELAVETSTKAEAYLQQAVKAYSKWGAYGKVASLQERYPFLQTLPGTGSDVQETHVVFEDNPSSTMPSKLQDGLDKEWIMDALRKASQAIAKETAEIQLLETFLHLAIRVAGAERGLVLLGKGGQLDIEAEEDINTDEENLESREGQYSAAVVQYVMRTREAVILADARQSIFATDSYVKRHVPRSILCLPLRYPDHREGVLYLENNLTTDAFHAERLEVLEMAFSRTAYIKLWQLQEQPNFVAKTAEVKAVPSLVESLSNREIEILRLMAEGMSNKEIALQLEITEGTVKSHASNLFGKLQVNRRVQAISRARELQLLG